MSLEQSIAMKEKLENIEIEKLRNDFLIIYSVKK